MSGAWVNMEDEQSVGTHEHFSGSPQSNVSKGWSKLSSTSDTSLSFSNSSEFLEDQPSTSGYSSEMDKLMQQREAKRVKVHECLRELKQLAAPGKKMGTLDALVHAVDTVRQIAVKHASTVPRIVSTVTADMIASQATTSYALALTIKEPMVIGLSPMLQELLAFPQDLIKGRQLEDFVHRKDWSTVCSQIAKWKSELEVNPDGLIEYSKTTEDPFCFRLRKYKSLNQGFGLSHKFEHIGFYARCTLQRVPGYEDYIPDGGSGSSDEFYTDICYMMMELEPIKSAYKESFEVPEHHIFSTQHNMHCVWTTVDTSCIQLMGYLPQDIIGSSIFDLYHPEDLHKLQEAHRQVILSPSVPLKSEPIKMLPRNKSPVVVETEWSSFVNPWTGKLEFIIGRHTILRGPEDPAVFGEGSLMDVMIPSIRQTQAIQNEIRGLLMHPERALTKSKDKDTSLSPTAVDNTFYDVLPVKKKTTDRLFKQFGHRTDLDMYLKLHDSMFKPKMKVPSPKSGSSSETGVSYDHYNYTQNIKRFLMSCPKTHSSEGSFGPKSSRSPTEEDIQRDSDSDSDKDVACNIQVDLVPKPPSFGSSTKVLVCDQEQPEDLLPCSPATRDIEIIEEIPPRTVVSEVTEGNAEISPVFKVPVDPATKNTPKKPKETSILKENSDTKDASEISLAAKHDTEGGMVMRSPAYVLPSTNVATLTCENLELFNKFQERKVIHQFQKEKYSFEVIDESNVLQSVSKRGTRWKRGRSRNSCDHQNKKSCVSKEDTPVIQKTNDVDQSKETNRKLGPVNIPQIQVQHNPDTKHDDNDQQFVDGTYMMTTTDETRTGQVMFPVLTTAGILGWPMYTVGNTTAPSSQKYTVPQLASGFYPSGTAFRPFFNIQQQSGMDIVCNQTPPITVTGYNSGMSSSHLQHLTSSSGYGTRDGKITDKGNSNSNGNSRSSDNQKSLCTGSVSTEYLLESDSTLQSKSSKDRKTRGRNLSSGSGTYIDEKNSLTRDTIFCYQIETPSLQSVLKSDQIALETTAQSNVIVSQFHQLLDDIDHMNENLKDETDISRSNTDSDDVSSDYTCLSSKHEHGLTPITPKSPTSHIIGEKKRQKTRKKDSGKQKSQKACAGKPLEKMDMGPSAETSPETSPNPSAENNPEPSKNANMENSAEKSTEGNEKVEECDKISDKDSVESGKMDTMSNNTLDSKSSDITPSDQRSNEEGDHSSSIKESDQSSATGKDDDSNIDTVIKKLFVPCRPKFLRRPLKDKTPLRSDVVMTEEEEKCYEVPVEVTDVALARDKYELQYLSQPGVIHSQLSDLLFEIGIKKRSPLHIEQGETQFDTLFRPVSFRVRSDGDAMSSTVSSKSGPSDKAMIGDDMDTTSQACSSDRATPGDDIARSLCASVDNDVNSEHVATEMHVEEEYLDAVPAAVNMEVTLEDKAGVPDNF